MYKKLMVFMVIASAILLIADPDMALAAGRVKAQLDKYGTWGKDVFKGFIFLAALVVGILSAINKEEGKMRIMAVIQSVGWVSVAGYLIHELLL